VVATLVSEIVLCVKEVNQKTRAAAYGLLVDLARAMHEAEPPSLPDLDERMEGLELQGVPLCTTDLQHILPLLYTCISCRMLPPFQCVLSRHGPA
jgi:hypothetical protein